MATNFLSLRNTQALNPGGSTITDGSLSLTSTNKQWWVTTVGQPITYSSLTGSTMSTDQMSTSKISLASSIITLGSNAGATKSNFSEGSYAATSWLTSTPSGQAAAKSVKMSSTGQYQLVVTASAVYLSTDSGSSWASLGVNNGLPTGATWVSGSISSSGQYILLADGNGGFLWVSADYGTSFNNTTPVGVTPYCWLKFNGNATDTMGTITPTVTGSVTYVTGITPGSQAVSIANTAGETATNYVRGSWTGSPTGNFTVSFWMNMQSYSVSTNSIVFSAYSGVCAVFINTVGQLTWYMPTGSSAVNVGYTSALTANTWYYVTIIFQTNGLCSFYVNNVLIGSVVNSNGTGSYTTSNFGLGTFQSDQPLQAFNGYIDDFKLINSAITYQNAPIIPPYVWLKFESNTTDSGSAGSTSAVTVTGSVTYSPGPVGSTAVRLANTAGGTLTTGNYIRGNFSPGSNVTISAWIQFQNIPGPGEYSSCIALGTSSANIMTIFYQGGVGLRFGYAKTSVGDTVLYTASTIATNTWYHVYYSFQASGTSTVYINGQLVASVSTTTFSAAIDRFAIGVNAPNTAAAFDGFIDDFRIYNTAVPYNPMIPNNYLQSAVSGSGQYMLASAQSGNLISSSNYGVTWSSQGQILGFKNIIPNTTGLSNNTWSSNQITWTASASSVFSGSYFPYNAFDNSQLNVSNTMNTASNYNTDGTYTNVYSTTIQGGIGATPGEWIQLQSSIPIILQTYSMPCGYWAVQYPKTYIIVGSTDGSTWYPIQNVNITTNPFTGSSQQTVYVTPLIVNYSGTQAIQGSQSGSCTTTSYATSANAYTYFRIIIKTIWPTGFGASSCNIAELYYNFNINGDGSLVLSHSGQYALATVGNAAGSVMPNMSGLAAATWTQGGVGWTASASTSSNPTVYAAFNNSYANVSPYSWASASTYNSSGVYTGSVSTTVQGIGSVAGEWIQLQSTTPLVMTSYLFASGGTQTTLPYNYYIAGSTDGLTWYPIHYFSMITNPLTAGFSTYTSYVLVNYNGTQTISGAVTGSGSTTAYAYSTNPYTYFRLIATSIGASGLKAELMEWMINFQSTAAITTNFGSTWTGLAGTSFTDQVLAMSGSGQYTMGTSNIVPFSRLTLNNTNADAQGGLSNPTWSGSAYAFSNTVYKVGTHSLQFTNPTAGGTSGMTYLKYTVPTLLNFIPAATISCWVYPTALPSANWACPVGFNNDTATGYGPNFGIYPNGTVLFQFYGVNGANSYVTSTTAIAINTWSHLACAWSNGTAYLYVNGTLQATLSLASVGNIISVTGSNVAITTMYLGTLTTNFGAYAGYVDDVRIYTSALSAGQIAGLYANTALDTQAITISNNWLGSSIVATTAVFPSITSPIVAAASSYTGQYMVAVNGASTNNVYYSTNYGAAWTALTIPNGAGVAMIGCTMSYDGSYLTVSSATATYTLNRNASGYTLAIGSQAGQYNQGQNAIAIGYQAGLRNQAGSSIVINATGSTMNAVQPGFYVAPVAQATSAATTGSLSLLGYGADCQVVQTSLLYRHASANAESQILTVSNPITLPSDQGSVHVLQRWYEYTSNTSILDLMAVRTTTGGSWDTTGLRLQSRVDATYQGWMQFGGSSSNYGLQFGVGGSTSSPLSVPAAMTISVGGNIGIGTTAPAGYTLDVYGTARVRGAVNASGYVQALHFLTVNGGGPYTSYSVIESVHEGSAGNNLILNPSGSVGIGTTTPDALLTVWGSASKTGGGSWSTASDRRMKTDITNADLDRCYELVKAIPLTHYKYKDGIYTEKQLYDRGRLGWIAQDVEVYFPKAVELHPFTFNENVPSTIMVDGQEIMSTIQTSVTLDDCRSFNADQIYAAMYGATQKLIHVTEVQQSSIQIQQSTQQSQQDAIAAHESTIQAQQSTITAQQDQITSILDRLTAAGIA